MNSVLLLLICFHKQKQPQAACLRLFGNKMKIRSAGSSKIRGLIRRGGDSSRCCAVNGKFHGRHN